MSSGAGTGLSSPLRLVMMTDGGAPRSRRKSFVREDAASRAGGTSK
jgi:hypothetical protein